MDTSKHFPPGYLEEYTGHQLIIVTTITLVLATLLLGFRLYVRSLAGSTRGWDDYLLPPAWLLLMGLGVIMYISVPKAGVGRHVQAVAHENPKKIVMLNKLVYVLDWCYVPANALSRLSVVILYLRVFTNKFSRFFAWVVCGYLTLYCIATIIAAQVECRPLAYTWDKTIKGGKCFDVVMWWKWNNIPNLIPDVAIMVLPIPTVWTLKVSKSRKAGISLVCLTGSVGFVAACVRTAEFFTSKLEEDPTWFATPTLCMTIIECGMYFCAACLIGLRPLLTKIVVWTKEKYSTLRSSQRSYPTSRNGSSSKGTTIKPFRMNRKNKPFYGDLGSTSNIVTIGGTELSHIKTPTEKYNIANEEADQIRVDTTVEVNSSNGADK